MGSRDSLDAGRRPGLAPGGQGLHCGDCQPVRGAVHSSGETGGAGTYYQQVVDTALGFGAAETESPGKLGIVRVPQHLGLAQHHDGRVLRGDSELTQQFFCLAVLVEIDEAVGQPVSSRELEQPFGVR